MSMVSNAFHLPKEKFEHIHHLDKGAERPIYLSIFFHIFRVLNTFGKTNEHIHHLHKSADDHGVAHRTRSLVLSCRIR